MLNSLKLVHVIISRLKILNHQHSLFYIQDSILYCLETRSGYYLFQRYRNVATIRGRLLLDVAATIYFSATAMRRLFEGGYYSKYRRRGYYLFQLYRNVATIRGRLLFEVQTSQLLFISALPQCGDYSRAATIRSTDTAATIYFSSTAMWRLFEGGYYSKYRRRSYYLFQLYRNVATIRGRLLFEVQTPRLLFISALPQWDNYSRAATIRSTDAAATIYFSSTAMWRLFEGGYYSKYRRRGYYLFQLYRNAATIRGWLLFEVQTSRLLFISALPQCGDYSRAATIRGAAFIQGNTVYAYTYMYMHTCIYIHVHVYAYTVFTLIKITHQIVALLE